MIITVVPEPGVIAMKYSKRFLSFFNRKSAPYLPEWVIEAWYVQFSEVDFHLVKAS